MASTLLLITDPDAPGGADLFSLELAKAALSRGIRTAIQPMPRSPDPLSRSFTASAFARDSDTVVVNGLQIDVLRAVRSMNKKTAVRLLGLPGAIEAAPSGELLDLLLDADLLLLPTRHMIDTMRGLGLGERSLHLVPFAYDRVPAESAALLPLSAMPPSGFHMVCMIEDGIPVHSCFASLPLALSLMPRDCHLSVVGDGAAAAALKGQARELGVLGRMSFLGGLSRARANQQLRFAQALLSPCVHTGYPVSALNAFSEGCPVIAADGGGHPELVAHGTNGLLVPPGDPRAVAEAAIRLRHSEGLSRSLIENGIKAVKEHTWDRTALAAIEAIEALGAAASENGA